MTDLNLDTFVSEIATFIRVFANINPTISPIRVTDVLRKQVLFELNDILTTLPPKPRMS